MHNATDIRNCFWNVYFVEGKPREFWGKSGQQLPDDLRRTFEGFVAHLLRERTISPELAAIASL